MEKSTKPIQKQNKKRPSNEEVKESCNKIWRNEKNYKNKMEWIKNIEHKFRETNRKETSLKIQQALRK